MIRTYYCQQPGCEAVMYAYGPGRPSRWCKDHKRRYVRERLAYAEQFKGLPCCADGICPQHIQWAGMRSYQARNLSRRSVKGVAHGNTD